MAFLNYEIKDEMVVHELSKSFNDNGLMKSVSIPGSHKSPFQREVELKEFHINKLPKDFAYIKRIIMPNHKDLLGKYEE